MLVFQGSLSSTHISMHAWSQCGGIKIIRRCLSAHKDSMINYFSEVNGRKLEPHSELGLFSLPNLHLLDLSQPKQLDLSQPKHLSQPNSSKPDSSLPSGTTLVLPELLACLPISLNELRVERRLILGGLPSVQVRRFQMSWVYDQLVDVQVARAREMVARLASLKTIQLSGSAFIGGVAGRLGR